MDPNRIESITILKDAAASAMYGSRAANGVVVITTVAPVPGKVSVSYSMTGDGNCSGSDRLQFDECEGEIRGRGGSRYL